MNARFISLLYHDVLSGPNPDASGFSGTNAAEYKLHKDEFGRHLETITSSLRDTGRNVYCQSKLETLEPAPVLLTFDDGGVSAHSSIAPMLESRDWRGYFFIPTNMIGRPGFMDADQIRELGVSGHVIGSHSASHPKRISECSDAELARQWGESIEVLSDLLGWRVDIASIPGGFYSRRVAAAASAAGIRTLFTSEPLQRTGRVENAVLVGRFSVKRDDPASLPAEFVASKLSRRFRSYAYWNTKKLAKKVTGPIYPWVRNVYLSRKS